MSVTDTAPKFMIALTELLARARSAEGRTFDEKVFMALKAHADTAEWLTAMKPFAFKKGAAVKAVPAAKSHWEGKARDVVIRAIFATAKNVRSGEISIPGRGKVKVSESDMLDPGVQYGLTQGDLDYTGLAALQGLRNLAFSLDAEAINADADAAAAQKDWAHGEHELQQVDGELKALGIFADTAENAAEQLTALGTAPELLAQIEGLSEREINPMRDYGTFRTSAWYSASAPRGNSVQAKPIPTAVQQALAGALYITGTWDSLQIPRALKAEAFDRLVELFTAAMKRERPPVVAANTDDLVGKAGVMAATALGIKTVAVQLAGWDFKPARMQMQWCQRMPRGVDVQYAQADLQVRLAELVGSVLSLGTVDDVLTHNVQRQAKNIRSLDSSWTKHNGLY